MTRTSHREWNRLRYTLWVLGLAEKLIVTPFLFVTDLDNTLVGDDAALAELNQHLSRHRQEHGSRIVYATGRSPTLFQQLRTEKKLLDADALALSVGTVIYHNGTDTPDPDWAEQLAHSWDRDQVVAAASHFTDLVPQPTSEQTPFKVSFFLTQDAAVEVIPQLEAALRRQQLDIQIVYSSGQDLDILPRRGNKGYATTFLQQAYGFAPERTVVCGDSGNDLALFQHSQACGIIVGNARPELLDWHHSNPSPHRYLAQQHCAAGILEGLRHFGLLE